MLFKNSLTVLIDERANADATHVEAIEKVLNAVLRYCVDVIRVLELENALCHRLDDGRVPIANLPHRLGKAV